MARRAAMSWSTKVARAAPRDSASMPIAPLPGEQVEHRRLLHHAEAAEGVEGGLPHPIGRGSGGRALRGHELAAPRRPRDDPHRRRR